MSKIKLQINESGRPRVVYFDPEATKGARIGSTLLMPDGSVATIAALRKLLLEAPDDDPPDFSFEASHAVDADQLPYEMANLLPGDTLNPVASGGGGGGGEGGGQSGGGWGDQENLHLVELNDP